MEVYKSKYLQLTFFAELELIEWTWLPETSHMEINGYEQEILKVLDIFLQLRPKKVIADSQNMFFSLAPDMQEWTDHTFLLPVLEIGLKLLAIIISQELITQLATEQLMEEEAGSKFITRYFENKEDAKKWILSLES